MAGPIPPPLDPAEAMPPPDMSMTPEAMGEQPEEVSYGSIERNSQVPQFGTSGVVDNV